MDGMIFEENVESVVEKLTTIRKNKV